METLTQGDDSLPIKKKNEDKSERQIVSGAGESHLDQVVGQKNVSDIKKRKHTRIPIVESKFQKIRNTILEKEEFKDVGYNQSKSWEIRPAILHFGGFKVGQVLKKTVHLMNASSVSQRLHILPPTTPNFKIFYNKKGVVAPGMTQPVTVVFEPKEYRYHYDFFRLHKGNNDNVVIPFHGYPVMNKFIFPEKIDFGHVPLAKKASKIIPLQCEVPIAFEYEIKVNKDHKDIKIYPLKGVIPASGVMEIHIDCVPQSFGTKTAEISVCLEQFNCQPITCQIQAYSQVNYYREESIKHATKRVINDKYREKLDDICKLEDKNVSSTQQKKKTDQ